MSLDIFKVVWGSWKNKMGTDQEAVENTIWHIQTGIFRAQLEAYLYGDSPAGPTQPEEMMEEREQSALENQRAQTSFLRAEVRRRHEVTYRRAFDKAVAELERRLRMAQGEFVPPPKISALSAATSSPSPCVQTGDDG